MAEESELLTGALNAIQVTVSETNKRAGLEQLTSLLTDIQTHLNLGSLMKAAHLEGNEHLIPFIEMKEVLDLNRVVKHGTCTFIPAIPSVDGKKPKNAFDCKMTYILLKDVLVFFGKDNSNVRQLNNSVRNPTHRLN